MINATIALICLIIGVVIGIAVIALIAGKKLRDQFLGKNLRQKAIVINWLSRNNDPIHLVWNGATVFKGHITRMSTDIGFGQVDTLQITVVKEKYATLNRF